jgi:glucokinase
MENIITYTFDPEIIIIGGSIGKSFEYFEAEMNNAISGFSYSNSVKNFKTEVSGIENVAVLGAAALYYNDAGK